METASYFFKTGSRSFAGDFYDNFLHRVSNGIHSLQAALHANDVELED